MSPGHAGQTADGNIDPATQHTTAQGLVEGGRKCFFLTFLLSSNQFSFGLLGSTSAFPEIRYGCGGDIHVVAPRLI